MRMNISKKWKKLGAVMMTAVMSMTMGMTALAEEESKAPETDQVKTAVLSIQGTEEIKKEGAKYDIYQVLTFQDAQQLSTGDYVYTNVAADENSPFLDIINSQEYEGKTGLEAITSFPQPEKNNVPSSKIAQFAAELAASEAKPDAVEFIIGSTGSVTLPYGYYLVVETEASADKIGVKSAPMLVALPQISGSTMKDDVTITVKTSLPEIDKQIVDSVGNGTTVNNGAVGDIVKYNVKSDIPLYGAGVTDFNYVITDILSKGLTYQDDMKISLWVDDEKVADLLENGEGVFADTVSTAANDAGDAVITVEVNNRLNESAGTDNKAIYKYAEDGRAHFVLEYSVKINENAVQGNGGNENSVDLEYETDHKTEEKVVSTFTTSLTVIKKEQSSTGAATETPLKGAEFKLLKKTGENTYEELKNADGETLILTTDEAGKLMFPGLSEGEYKLVEHKAPSGFNLDTTERPFALTFDEETKTWTSTGTEDVITLSPAADGIDGTFETTITNVRGMALPGTGGMGTTIFKTAGGAIILLACVMLLIYYKKKNGTHSQQ